MTALRGAIAPVENNAAAISAAACRLVEAVLEQNRLSPSDLEYLLFSATADLNACYPAAAVRKMDGLSSVPMLCLQEMAVRGSMGRCLRLLAVTCRPLRSANHAYLGQAAALRPDWSEGNNAPL